MSFFDLFGNESETNLKSSVKLFDNVLSVVSTSCGDCKAYFHCCNPKMGVSGDCSNGIMIILPPITKEEDIHGVIGYGDKYVWFMNLLQEIGIDYRQCAIVNSTGCRSFYDDNGKIINSKANMQIDMCSVRINNIISQYKPKLIISLGSINLQLTVKPYWSRGLGDIYKWHGFCIPLKKWNCFVVNVLSPDEVVYNEYFLSNKKWKEANEFNDKVQTISNTGFYKIYTGAIKRDIVNAYKKAFNNPVPVDPAEVFPVKPLSMSESIDYLKYVLDKVSRNNYSFIAADLETSGLKPFNKNQFIYSIGMMIDEKTGAVAFKLENEHIPILRQIASYNPKIAGANWKFDRLWMKVKYDIDFNNLYHDVVIAAHLNDNRDGVTSLKFNTFVNFGVSYEDTVHKYLEGVGTNGLNKIKEAPLNDLLYYNALDVLYTFLLVDIQRKEWFDKQTKRGKFAWDLYHKGSIALSELEYNGITMDLKKAEKSRSYCIEKLKEVEEKYKKDPIWKEWVEIYGNNASILSDTQIIDIFIKRKGFFPKGISKKSKPKADYEWLSKMIDQCPFLSYVLEVRKWEKILNTYLKSFFIETNDDGKIRCFYSNTKSSSYRMSSDSPNLTNQASRDSEQVQLLKTCFVVDPPDKVTGEEFYLISTDFSQLENFVNASISNDSYFLSTLNGGVDLHKDNALFMFFCTEEEFQELKKYDEENHTKFAKTLRNAGKTASFSTLYGANAITIGTSLWKAMEENNVHVTPYETAKDRIISALNLDEKYKKYLFTLKNKQEAITKEEFYLDCYIKHAQEFFDNFWKKRMKNMGEWRENTFNEFCKSGYVDYPTGLRSGGIFSRNTILNAPGQGSGACVTMWCICRINLLLKQYNMKSSLRLQIHDDIVGMVPRSEVKKYVSIVKQVMEDETCIVFPWLKTKLHIDPEISSTTWADKISLSSFLENNKL